jgi:hypothetical protein
MPDKSDTGHLRNLLRQDAVRVIADVVSGCTWEVSASISTGVSAGFVFR